MTASSDIELLKVQYDKLMEKRKKDEQRKMKALAAIKGPTECQRRLYEEGRTKMLLERREEGSNHIKDQSSLRRDPEPAHIPVCDRLYEQGMQKVRAEKIAEEEDKSRRIETNKHPPAVTIPVCDRLYKEGMNKLYPEKTVQQRAEKELGRCINVRNKPTTIPSIPVCNRLYEEGMNKILKKKKESDKKDSQARSVRAGVPPIPVCDRLYIAGLNKIRIEREKCQSDNNPRTTSITNETYSISTDNTGSLES